MRSWILLFVLFSVAAFAAPPGPVVTTCAARSPKDLNLIRVTSNEARQMLARKTDISLPSSLSSKFQSQDVTLEVDVDRGGEIECWSLLGDRAEDKFSDDDKTELRGAIATSVDFWVFRPYSVGGQPAEVRASYRLHVEPKKLTTERWTILKPKY
jgi:hypothetical protein